MQNGVGLVCFYPPGPSVCGFGAMLAQFSPASCNVPCLQVSAMGPPENVDAAGTTSNLFRAARKLQAEKALSTVC